MRRLLVVFLPLGLALACSDYGNANGEANRGAPGPEAGAACLADAPGCCVPRSDWCVGRCGATTDNCGHAVDCGTCPDAGQDAATSCVPQCSAIVCEKSDAICGATCSEATSNCKKSTRLVLTYAELNSVSGKTCSNSGPAINDGECFVAVKRYCRAKGWAAGWFVENGPTDLAAMCVSGPSGMETTTVANLMTFQNECSSSSLWATPPCVAATDSFCISKGYVGGLGITELGGINNTDPVEVMCLEGTYVGRHQVTAPSPECDDITTGPCYAKVDQICMASFGGNGGNAVQISDGKMDIMCVQ